MENPDNLTLSGKQLQILVTIYKAGSLSLAGKMLNMNQSTLSYWLDQLRDRFDDALFVRVGQGMQPTERMERILRPASEIIRQLDAIMEPMGYDPERDNGVLRIACTSVERELIIHPVIKFAASVAPNLTFEILNPGSSYQMAEALRSGSLDIAFYPAVLDSGDDLFQRVLFPIEDVVFFDPAFPLNEGDIKAYCERPHARVAFGPDAEFSLDRRMARAGHERRVGLQATDFESIARLIRGTPIIATLPLHLHKCSFCELDWVLPPLPNKPVDFVIYWHARNKSSERHRFWRHQIIKLSAEIAR